MTAQIIDHQKAINLSISIIQAYCKKDLSWIPEYMDERTMFIRSRKGQFLSGGTELINAWLPDHPLADFSVTDISASSIMTGHTTCEAVLRYDVIWYKDDKIDIIHPQILHISNQMELDERDLVYNTFGDTGTAGIAPLVPSVTARNISTWIMIHGTGGVLNRYPSDSIIWIESAYKGKKSIVHTRDQDIHCINKFTYFMEEYPDIFIQPSVSYIVNPLYIKKISRFQAELWNGKILRIPEKKYTGFKKDFESFSRSDITQFSDK